MLEKAAEKAAKAAPIGSRRSKRGEKWETFLLESYDHPYYYALDSVSCEPAIHSPTLLDGAHKTDPDKRESDISASQCRAWSPQTQLESVRLLKLLSPRVATGLSRLTTVRVEALHSSRLHEQPPTRSIQCDAAMGKLEFWRTVVNNIFETDVVTE